MPESSSGKGKSATRPADDRTGNDKTNDDSQRPSTRRPSSDDSSKSGSSGGKSSGSTTIAPDSGVNTLAPETRPNTRRPVTSSVPGLNSKSGTSDRTGVRSGNLNDPRVAQSRSGSSRLAGARDPRTTTVVQNRTTNITRVHTAACGHSACRGAAACSFTTRFREPVVHRHVYHHYHHYRPFPVRHCDYPRSRFSFSVSFSSYSGWYHYHRPAYAWHFGYYRPVYHGYYYRPRYWCGWHHHGWCDWHCRPRYVTIVQPVYYGSYYSSTSFYRPAEPPVYEQSYADPYQGEQLRSSASRNVAEGAVASNDGWGLLSTGRDSDARRVFDREMNARVNDGLPQVGFALSSALLGRYEEAAPMMRRALRNDPEALFEIPMNEQLATRLGDLIKSYERAAQRDDRDALLMTSTLHLILGEYTLANIAADRLVAVGDRDDAAANLSGMIREQLDEAMEQMEFSDEPAAPAQPEPQPKREPVPF